MAFKHNLDNEVLNAKRNKIVVVEILNMYPNNLLLFKSKLIVIEIGF